MNKMYQDLKESFWWSGMKREIAQYVGTYLTCQKEKVEHQRPGGLLQPWLSNSRVNSLTRPSSRSHFTLPS